MNHPQQHTLVTAAVGLAGCLLLAGCGGGSSPKGTAAPAPHVRSDATSGAAIAPATTAATSASASAPAVAAGASTACALVTEHDAATALGADPGPGSKFESHGSTQCQYGDAQTIMVLVNLTPARGKLAYDRMHGAPTPDKRVTVSDVAGVGDRAFAITAPHTAGIYFNSGDSLVLVSVMGRTATAPERQAVAMAKTAAGRI
jgi:hypothetical protein